jgi:hypothetical protein
MKKNIRFKRKKSSSAIYAKFYSNMAAIDASNKCWPWSHLDFRDHFEVNLKLFSNDIISFAYNFFFLKQIRLVENGLESAGQENYLKYG